MATIEYELSIDASPSEVYEASQDYSVRYLWDTFPEKIEILGGANQIEKGTRVLVLAKNGLKMEVEFVQVSPPATTAIKMIKGPFFLKSFAGSWAFKSSGNGATRVKFVYSIKAKRWAIPFVTDAIASWYFNHVIRARLAGLKAYCESHT